MSGLKIKEEKQRQALINALLPNLEFAIAELEKKSREGEALAEAIADLNQKLAALIRLNPSPKHNAALTAMSGKLERLAPGVASVSPDGTSTTASAAASPDESFMTATPRRSPGAGVVSPDFGGISPIPVGASPAPAPVVEGLEDADTPAGGITIRTSAGWYENDSAASFPSRRSSESDGEDDRPAPVREGVPVAAVIAPQGVKTNVLEKIDAWSKDHDGELNWSLEAREELVAARKWQKAFFDDAKTPGDKRQVKLDLLMAIADGSFSIKDKTSEGNNNLHVAKEILGTHLDKGLTGAIKFNCFRDTESLSCLKAFERAARAGVRSTTRRDYRERAINCFANVAMAAGKDNETVVGFSSALTKSLF